VSKKMLNSALVLTRASSIRLFAATALSGEGQGTLALPHPTDRAAYKKPYH